MTNVYLWPPVGVTGTEWTKVTPVSRSYSVLSGPRYVSAAQPPRRMATIVVAALSSRTKFGAGYMEALKEFLAGGEHLVRLHSYPINRHRDASVMAAARQSTRVHLTDGGVDVDLTDGGTETHLYTGRVLAAAVTTDDGFPAISVTGLVPGKIAAAPGEFVTIFEDADDATGETIMVMALAVADGAGAAVIRLMSAPTHGGRVNIGVSETAVFEAVEPPRSVQPVDGNWSYSWSFREVFEAEVPGGFTELDPWTYYGA